MSNQKERIKLSDHFNYRTMMRFTAPSIGMMIFTSIYGVVDGFFVSNYAGATAFAALNLVMPFIMIISTVGVMLGSGGSALVGALLGMEEPKKANETFSLIVYATFICGVIFAVLGYAITPWVSRMLGATDALMPYCVLYSRISMVSIAMYMLQNLFQTFLVTAERPHLGLAVTIAAGVTNMVLDFLFVGIFGWGLAGAAWATVSSEFVGGLVPMIYFFGPSRTNLHLGKTRMNWNALRKSLSNGMSEFFTAASMSIIGALFNFQLLKFAGENGVAAYGVIMYVNFIFSSIFFGFARGISPVISFHYGAANTKELQSLKHKCLWVLGVSSFTLMLLAELFAPILSQIFVGYSPELYALTLRGFRIFVLCFVFMAFNMFGSAFFTALNNGKVSAGLSIIRSFILQLIMVIVLPPIFGVDGVWMTGLVVDTIAVVITFGALRKYQKEYQY